jgi:DNA modification methylase
MKISDSVFRVMRHKARGIECEHPAVYPIDLPAKAMKMWEGVAYEPFSGSGTTIIAAEKTGRRCYAMELSPAYVDVAVKRWQDFTGLTATHAETGVPFG